MKTISIVLAALICLPALASAAPESVITGPYNVSFDLGLKSENYKINVIDPKITETLRGDKLTEYQIDIFGAAGTNKFMLIKIIYSEKPSPPLSGSNLEQILKQKDGEDPGVSKFESGTRTIDDASGAIASGLTRWDSETFVDTYHALYAPPFDPTRILVEIFSLFPWDDGTLQLLKTIHIEKINATA